MSQERLSRWAMISIKNQYLVKSMYNELIQEFASKNVRNCFL